MRRSWPILITTGILAFGGVLAAAGPAAAAGPSGAPGASVRPGGVMQRPGGAAGGIATGRQHGAPGGTSQTVVSSTNWAGYAATGASGQFTSVSSSWVQPAATCSFGDQYSAFWVGLDGYSSSTVEQTGSEVDCAGRTAEYSAWYEMYPAYPVYFNNTVRPGDNFTGSVTYSGGNFVIKLTDSTQRWSQTVTQALSGALRSSAEVIAEAPSSSRGGVLPLTNFGTVNFTGATVNGTGLCNSSPVEIIMPSARVSSLSCPGNFSISYNGIGGGRPPWPWF
jgi:Peptidase A4 family